MLRLPYGRAPYLFDPGEAAIELLEAPAPPDDDDLALLLDRALDAPIASERLEVRARSARRITIIVSDHTRVEPRAAFLDAILPRVPPDARITIAVATGTHGASPIPPLGIDRFLGSALVVNHDGSAGHHIVDLGTTRRGTPIRVNRCLLESDLVIATGCIRPHYFAGFGAGAKAIFPGLGERVAIRKNHELKLQPTSRAGIVEGNPCRDDIEEAAAAVPTPTFLLNGVVAADERIHAAVAGHVVTAFRTGASLARTWFTVRARAAPVVIASDRLPITATLYQAAKIAAAVAPLVAEGGRLILVAECADGVGPLDVVNESILRIGVLPRLAKNVSIELISSLPSTIVEQTLVRPRTGICDLSSKLRVLVVPHASHLLVEIVP